MNKRIKKKKAKQAQQQELEQLEQLEQELAKLLSPEQVEAIVDAISQAVQEFCTVIGYVAENIVEALRRWEEELDKEDSNQG